MMGTHGGLRAFIIGGLALVGLCSFAFAQQGSSPEAALNILEEECDDDFQLLLTFKTTDPSSSSGQSAAERWRLKLFFHQQGDKSYYVMVTPERLSLVKRLSSHAIVLGVSRQATWNRVNANQLVVKRRNWKITVIANRQVSLIAYDDELRGGMAGYEAQGESIKVENARYQPIETIFFSDDFMRGAQDAQQWQILGGTWRPLGIESSALNPALSANPFSFQVIADQPALATAGYWFWDNYAFEAAVRPRTDKGAIGLAVYVQDRDNYLLFRWSSAADDGKRQLLKVVNGKPEVVAEQPGGFVGMQWYKLAIKVRDNYLQAFIDDELVLRAQVSLFGQGKVGLYADGGANAQFDDVKVQSWQSFSDDFRHHFQGRWTVLGGEWASGSGFVRSEPVLVKSMGQRVNGSMGEAHWLATGSVLWKNYVAAVNFKVNGEGAAGLAFYFTAPQNSYLIRCATAHASASYRGRKQLVALVKGGERILAQAQGGILPGKWYRLKVEADSGVVRASLNDQPLFASADFTHLEGKIALFAEGKTQAVFKSAVVYFLPPKSYAPKLTTQFTKEDSMSGWASGRAAWMTLRPQQTGGGLYLMPTGTPTDGIYWHKADFFGDLWVRALLPSPKQIRGSLSVIVGAQSRDVASGYQVVLFGDGSGKVSLEVRREGERVARQDAQPENGKPLKFDVHRDGGFILASLNDEPVLAFQDHQPLRGTKVGIHSNGVPIDFENLQAASSQMADYTFASAPTDWWVQRGSWEVTERWTCSPQWSFFGGIGSAAPVLWSKKAFKGDITVEAYISIRMHEDGYGFPGDLNISICGDGMNLDSGYSFIYAGWNNSRSRIMRGTKPLAERTDQLGIISGSIAGAFHRYWWYLRVQKQGNKLLMFVDDRLILEAEDKNPLDGGRVAIWTLNKGILVARTRIWFEAPARMTPFTEIAQKFSINGSAPPSQRVNESTGQRVNGAIVFDFEQDAGEFRGGDGESRVVLRLENGKVPQGRGSLRVINAVPGGTFEVKAIRTPFDAMRFPVIRFAYRLQPDVKVNLRVRVGGVEHAVIFTGSDQLRPGIRPLGAFKKVVADGQWHEADFNLKEALLKLYPSAMHLPVQEIAFANLDPNPYLFAGVGGNHFGTFFDLDNFRITSE